MTRITQMGMPVVTRDGLGYSVCPVLILNQPLMHGTHTQTAKDFPHRFSATAD